MKISLGIPYSLELWLILVLYIINIIRTGTFSSICFGAVVNPSPYDRCVYSTWISKAKIFASVLYGTYAAFTFLAQFCYKYLNLIMTFDTNNCRLSIL